MSPASRRPAPRAAARSTGPRTSAPTLVQFADNALLPALFGEHDANLARIERQLGVSLASRGNRVAISGSADAVETAREVLNALYARLGKDLEVGASEVDAAVRLSQAGGAAGGGGTGGSAAVHDSAGAIRTRKRHITPRSPTQAEYIKALRDNELVFGLGPAGTGKTYLAVAVAVEMLASGRVDRIILSRPAVEAGEKLGYLPGDLQEKVDPYLRPLQDALYDMLPGEQVVKHLTSGEIEVAPLAFMRGRTLANSFVILDEAQNTTPVQMKMFLTRLGENGRMAITGDLSQVDLPKGQPSGLSDAVDMLQDVEGLAFVRFSNMDVVRHPLVTKIVRAYEAREAARDQGEQKQGGRNQRRETPGHSPSDN